MKFKKTSAAIIVASIAVSGSSYAWADEALFQPITMDSIHHQQNPYGEVVVTETLAIKKASENIPEEMNTQKEESIVTTNQSHTKKSEETTEATTKFITEEKEKIEDDTLSATSTSTVIQTEEYEDDITEQKDEANDDTLNDEELKDAKAIFTDIPEDYPASNIEALKQAYDNAKNETAKAAILRNAEKAMEKFEAKQEAIKEEDNTIIEINSEVVEEIQKEKEEQQPTTDEPVIDDSEQIPSLMEDEELPEEQKTKKSPFLEKQEGENVTSDED